MAEKIANFLSLNALKFFYQERQRKQKKEAVQRKFEQDEGAYASEEDEDFELRSFFENKRRNAENLKRVYQNGIVCACMLFVDQHL